MILPGLVLTTCYELQRTAPTIDYANGGQYKPAKPVRMAFRGAVLPMSAQDLRYAPQGAYTVDTRKLYTDRDLQPGCEVEACGATYTVTSSADYGYINGLKRYILERKGASA